MRGAVVQAPFDCRLLRRVRWLADSFRYAKFPDLANPIIGHVDSIELSGKLGAFCGFCKRFCEFVEMLERGGRQLDLLATCVFRVGQREPAFFPHRCDARMERCRRTQLAVRHHVANGKSIVFLRRASHELQNFFFERIEHRQRWQATQRFGQLQKSKINVSGTFHRLRNVQGGGARDDAPVSYDAANQNE
ncbi:hypothetical protein PUN4_560093 [Paraburkholderia unamae]|nr:hypothetical protein PUN4_560093 [Paraburkholderia unamae]